MFPSGFRELEIDLCDNPYIEKWYKTFVPHFNMQSTVINDIKVPGPTLLQTAKINQIREHLNTCKSFKGLLPGNVVDEVELHIDLNLPSDAIDLNQDLLNKLHRYFTESKKLVVEERRWKNWQSVTSILDKINDEIHDLEYYCNTANKNLLAETKQNFDEVCLTPTQIENHHWCNLDEKDREYHSACHYDVILGPQILGKSLWKSYIDNDNPNHWDTSGHHCNAGSLIIVPTQKQRENIYKSKSFIKWLTLNDYKHNAYYDFPVGNVKNKKELPEIVSLLNECSGNVETIFQR